MKHRDGSTGSGFDPASAPKLTAEDVQKKEFRLAFRGYNERDVDEFLDLVTVELQRVEEENRRLREQAEPASPGWGTGEADAVLARAREQATALVRDAEARAAAIGSGGGTDHRAVVAPYLNHERDFLQALGALVQGHAETIKAMVEEARRRAEQRAGGPTEQAPERAVAVGPPPPAEGPEPEDVVVVGTDEPSAPPPEPEEPALEEAREPQPEGARSLRELFWGED